MYFTFRYCSFRNDNLTSWTKQPFEDLFDLTFLNKYNLYIQYHTIKDSINDTNCFNLNGEQRACVVFADDNILAQLIDLNKDYVVLSQFWSLYKFRDFIDHSIISCILPSKHIMEKFTGIKNTIHEPYNFIHYRYEKDFTTFFKTTVESLDSLIETITFKNNDLKIYVATSNIKSLLDVNNHKYEKLLYKNDDTLADLNFEQRAFIDYMFGLHSVECYGHRKSSFSCMLNSIKNTNNYYAGI